MGDKMKQRVYLYDNIKGILIFLVVFGHVIESLAGAPFYKTLYIIIYSFHMPLFIYVSGYFTSYKPDKMVKTILYPYVIFQCLYVIFDRLVLKGTASTLSLVSPYWVLWYLPSLFIWRSLIPFFETKSKKKAVVLLTVSFILSLVAGFDTKLGYYLAFSRITVFFFFFLLAFYQKKFIAFEGLEKLRKNKTLKIIVLFVPFIFISLLVLFNQKINSAWFYGAYSYSYLDYNIFIRLGILVCSTAFIAFFNLFTANKKIPLLTYLGENCIYIFLLHGFFVKLLNLFKIQRMFNYNFFFLMAISLFIILICANKYTIKFTKYLVAFPERRTKNGNNSCDKQ